MTIFLKCNQLFDFLGNNVENIRLIVAIHNTRTGNENIVTNRVQSPKNPLHEKKIVNVPYNPSPQDCLKASQIIAKSIIDSVD